MRSMGWGGSSAFLVLYGAAQIH